MIDLIQLPSRREEGWRWSDLRSTLQDREPAQGEGAHIIERLASARGGAARFALAPGEQRVLLSHQHAEDLNAESARVDVGAGAHLTRIFLQTGEGVALSLLQVRLAAGASFRQFSLSEGGKLARLETHVEVAGEGARVELAGLYLVGAGRHADLTSVVTHQVAGATTNQLVKGVARKGGRGVFQGKIEVARGAQKTDARQHHAGLMLEEGAEIFAKPELMIFADDVSCAHGNTIGALDSEALFYLRSRGLPEAGARALLVEAHLAEAVPDWLDEETRETALGQIRGWLGAGS